MKGESAFASGHCCWAPTIVNNWCFSRVNGWLTGDKDGFHDDDNYQDDDDDNGDKSLNEIDTLEDQQPDNPNLSE